MSQPYPRMLYRGEEQIIVDTAEEQSKRERDGFMTYEAWRGEAKPKTRRKPKAE